MAAIIFSGCDLSREISTAAGTRADLVFVATIGTKCPPPGRRPLRQVVHGACATSMSTDPLGDVIANADFLCPASWGTVQ